MRNGILFFIKNNAYGLYYIIVFSGMDWNADRTD